MPSIPDPSTSVPPFDAQAEHDKYLRALAELENLRKRTARDITTARDQGEVYVATAFLPLVDDFQRAIEALEHGQTKAQLREGILLIFNRLSSVMRQLEIEGFETKGRQFAAQLMDAIAQTPNRTLPSGTVVDELEQGFTRKGKLLRPARVVVSTSVEDADEKPDAP